ncbi:HAD-IA family hydrolase [Singulisphaera acidiphila]|uniref:Haloacid dehalogenase superfamily protein, subfamily IA, variant 3 with third motif having DD or ED n=1 Tax=Singulisphaera acidiphila (strain ATCC BAA-1392 / DSM 18658 / VKM B-2454 / MOB10) TaxID=886293 RepID=L0DBS4_SINAD|nr:HAD-IA family hydrolase [Singulisphaera acidiphila]AGA26288.1 haloacid dehalogenase superfamily protein, subfamily IA, variant 3 with third motif having DD or ED [Singulisphaera acidiphila DSM 18658]
MVRVPTLFFDLGGVLLTNGWDTPARRSAAEVFGLDFQEFQTRHEMLKTAIETGRLSLDEYLKKAIFSHPRPFTPDEFKAFMFAQSKVLGETLAWVRELAKTQTCRLYTLNNESRELHEHRVATFHLDEIFRGFLVSCYLGQVKPDEGIYENALGIAACHPEDAIFIDDRALNVEPALALGFKAVQFKGLDPLRSFLKEYGLGV